MVLDQFTLHVCGTIIVVLCGVSFLLNTSFNRHDAPGRIWSVAFLAAILSSMALIVYDMNIFNWWVLVVSNASLAIAAGSMWSGTRVFNGRSPAYWFVGSVTAIVALSVVTGWTMSGGWAGAAALYFAVAILTYLSASESYRGRLRRNLNGRVLLVIFAAVSAFYAGKAIALTVAGPGSRAYQDPFGSAPTTVVNIVLIVTVATAMSVLRAESFRGRAVGDLTVGIHSAAGVLSARAFEQAAADHIERARLAGEPLVLVGADVDRLPALNTALGRAAGDGAIAAFAQTLRRSVPAFAVIGHTRSGRFLILAGLPTTEDAVALAVSVQTMLIDSPLEGSQQLRLSASFGIADTLECGYDLPALTAAVGTAISEAQAAGGNDIRIAPAQV